MIEIRLSGRQKALLMPYRTNIDTTLALVSHVAFALPSFENPRVQSKPTIEWVQSIRLCLEDVYRAAKYAATMTAQNDPKDPARLAMMFVQALLRHISLWETQLPSHHATVVLLLAIQGLPDTLFPEPRDASTST